MWEVTREMQSQGEQYTLVLIGYILYQVQKRWTVPHPCIPTISICEFKPHLCGFVLSWFALMESRLRP